MIFNKGSVEEQIRYYYCFGIYCIVSQHSKKIITVAEDAAKEQELSKNILLALQCWKLCLIL